MAKNVLTATTVLKSCGLQSLASATCSRERGASSSGPRERQLRALEVDPRAPYRRFPNDQKVRYGANPARPGTPRFRRYERYKEATTVGGARRLGATSQDISMDVAAGALNLL